MKTRLVAARLSNGETARFHLDTPTPIEQAKEMVELELLNPTHKIQAAVVLALVENE